MFPQEQIKYMLQKQIHKTIKASGILKAYLISIGEDIILTMLMKIPNMNSADVENPSVKHLIA